MLLVDLIFCAKQLCVGGSVSSPSRDGTAGGHGLRSGARRELYLFYAARPSTVSLGRAKSNATIQPTGDEISREEAYDNLH